MYLELKPILHWYSDNIPLRRYQDFVAQLMVHQKLIVPSL